MDTSGVPLLESVINTIVNPIIGLLIAVALVMVLWGAYQFKSGGDNAKNIETAKQMMMWGIVGLFLMVSCIGIVRVICNTIGSC